MLAQGDSNVRANLSTDGFKHIRSPAASPPPTSPLPPWSEPPPRPAWPTAQLSPSCFSRLHLSPPIASQAVRFSKPGHITPLGWLLTELTSMNNSRGKRSSIPQKRHSLTLLSQLCRDTTSSASGEPEEPAVPSATRGMTRAMTMPPVQEEIAAAAVARSLQSCPTL